LVDVGKWWDKAHTYSGDAANLTLDAKANGCFCEKLPGGGVRHMVVEYIEAGKMLRMSGALGPLQELAVTGVLTVKLVEAKGKTTLELTYKVGGYVPSGLTTYAKPVDAMLDAQVQRLKKYAEGRQIDRPSDKPEPTSKTKTGGELAPNPFDDRH
jgi:hypothetical protein